MLPFYRVTDQIPVYKKDRSTRYDLEEGPLRRVCTVLPVYVCPWGSVALCKEPLETRQTRIQVLTLPGTSSVTWGVTYLSIYLCPYL